MLENERGAALKRLFHRYYDDLCRYAASQLREAHAAEDVVQGVFLRLLRRGEMPEQPRAYLFRSVRNHAINQNQRQRVVRREHVPLATFSGAAAPADSRASCRDLSDAVEDALEELSGRQRQIFQLSRDGGLTYREIADVLGLSEKTVETHMGRALQALRESVAEYL